MSQLIKIKSIYIQHIKIVFLKVQTRNKLGRAHMSRHYINKTDRTEPNPCTSTYTKYYTEWSRNKFKFTNIV